MSLYLKADEIERNVIIFRHPSFFCGTMNVHVFTTMDKAIPLYIVS